jgi:hypothetical protein
MNSEPYASFFFLTINRPHKGASGFRWESQRGDIVAEALDHPARVAVTSILALQNSPEFSVEGVLANRKVLAAREKVFGVARLLEALFERTAPAFASTNGLAQMTAPLQQALNELNAFVANKNAGHIANAAGQFESGVFPFLWAFASPLETLSKSSISKLFASQSDATDRAIESLKLEEAEMLQRLGALAKSVDEQQKRFEDLVAGSAKERAEAAAGVAKLDQQFTQEEAARKAIFEQTLQGIREEFAELEQSARAESTKTLESLDEKRKQAAQIVQVVGNIGVTGNYRQIAISEAKQADFWRWATVTIFGVAIGFAVATFYKFWHAPITLENTWSIAVRLLYALAITGPALYTARESARHRSNSDRARQTELELASIGPFIELMPEEKKIQIRESLTASYFGKAVDAHTVNGPVDLTALKELVVEVVKAAKKN